MKKNLLVGLIVAPLMGLASVASASTYHFTAINPNQNNIDTAAAVGAQLTANVTAAVGGAYFTFTNPVGISSSIVKVYFSDPAPVIFSSFSIFNQTAGVDFSLDNNPANFPEGGPSFIEVATADAAGGGTNEVPNGINAIGESLTFLALFNPAYNFNSLLTALDTGDFKIGLQTRDNPAGGNPSTDRWLNDKGLFVDPQLSEVPLPAAAWLFGSALFGFISLSRRRNV